MVQGELFIDDKNGTQNQGASFFSAHRISLTLDKVILFSIASLILFALTFSFGYERGKRGAEERLQALTSHIETIPTVPTPPESTMSQDTASQPIATDTTKSVSINTAIAQTTTAAPASTTEESNTQTLSSETEVSKNVPSGKYAIQVATALSKEKAQKEVEKLGKKGYQSFFLQSGHRFAICVGSFETVKSAKPLLAEFKTKNLYSDAYVRPLS